MIKIIDLLSKPFKDQNFNKETNFNLNSLFAMYAISLSINE